MKSTRHVTLLCCLITLLPSIADAQFARQFYNSEAVREKGLAEVSFIGAGDIQLSLSKGEKIAARTGLGGAFWRIWPEEQGGGELQLDFAINVASSVDTIFAKTRNNIITNKRAFGNYVLSPVPSGQATDINFVFYFKEKNVMSNNTEKPLFKAIGNSLSNAWKRRLYIDGLQMNAFAASQFWRYDSTFVGPDGQPALVSSEMNADVIGWRVGIFHEFIPQYNRRESGISVRMGISYVGRSIQGDAGNADNSTNRERFLLNRETTYHGIEYSLTAKYGNIRAQAILPRMAANNPVAGLSGTQFITSISFVGGFPLPLHLKRPESKE